MMLSKVLKHENTQSLQRWVLLGVCLVMGRGVVDAHPQEDDSWQSNDEQEGWGTLVAVTAMRGSAAHLPCNIHSNDVTNIILAPKEKEQKDDPVLLVLWYKNASVTPAYSYDSRSRTSGPGGRQQWGDEAVWGPNGDRVRFDTATNPAHLTIKNVTGRDEGSYRCKVHFKSSPSWSQKIDLIIKDPPGFPRIEDRTGRRLEGDVGPYNEEDIVRLLCSSTGEPPPKLEWIGAHQGAPTPPEINGDKTRSAIDIKVSRFNSGREISCSTQSNGDGKQPRNTTTIKLLVNLPPIKVVLESPGAWVVAGQQTEFRCRVVGAHPKAVVQWWLSGKQLKQAQRKVEWDDGNETISMLNLIPKPQDDGKPLVCKAYAINIPGTVAQDQITLPVRYIPVVSIELGGDRAKNDGAGSIDVKQRSTVYFSCHVLANPTAYNVTWFHNGRPLRERNTNPKIVIDERSLRLVNVSAESHGLYTCVASNEEGDGQSNAINLNINYSPICREDQPTEYITERGGSALLSCSVAASPGEVTFAWAVLNDKGGMRRLPSVGRPEGMTGQYTVQNIKDHHIKIICWGQNAIGVQEEPCIFDILTQGRPGIVSNCKVTNHTTTGFLVQCPPKQKFYGHLETFYNLQVYLQNRASAGLTSHQNLGQSKEEPASLPFGALDDLVQNISSQNPQFIVEGLASGREFAVVIRAINKEGNSPPSVLSAFTLRDTAQTLQGMPSESSGGAKGSWGKKSRNAEVAGQEKDEEDVGSFAGTLIPPMIVVLVASLLVILSMLAGIIYALRRRARRRLLEREMEQQIKLNEELPYIQAQDSGSGQTDDVHNGCNVNPCLRDSAELEGTLAGTLAGTEVPIIVSPGKRLPGLEPTSMGSSRLRSQGPSCTPLNHILPSSLPYSTAFPGQPRPRSVTIQIHQPQSSVTSSATNMVTNWSSSFLPTTSRPDPSQMVPVIQMAPVMESQLLLPLQISRRRADVKLAQGTEDNEESLQLPLLGKKTGPCSEDNHQALSGTLKVQRVGGRYSPEGGVICHSTTAQVTFDPKLHVLDSVQDQKGGPLHPDKICAL